MSPFARWGWLGWAINAFLVVLNVACLVFLDGGALNWMAIGVCSFSGVFAFYVWREEARRERRWTP